MVGRPVDGPPRWMSTISSGSSIDTASDVVSLLSATPGPLVVVTPRWPANDGAERHADRGDLVLGLHGADPEVLVLGEFVEDVAGRGDRVRPEGDRAACASWPAATMPHASAVLPVMLVYSPAGSSAGRTS